MTDGDVRPSPVTTFWYSNIDDPATALGAGVHPDRRFGLRLVARLHRDRPVTPIGSFPLRRSAPAGAAEVYVGAFPGLTVLQAGTIDGTVPSALPEEWVSALESDTLFVSGHDRARGIHYFARWEDGVLRRSFSASPTTILENEGMPGVWESPFWSGVRPPAVADGPVPADAPAGYLPFDPEEMVDAASHHWLGFGLEDGPEVPVVGFATDGRRGVREEDAMPHRVVPDPRITAPEEAPEHWDADPRGGPAPLVRPGDAPGYATAPDLPGAAPRKKGFLARVLRRR